jgi:hypothetical protein
VERTYLTLTLAVIAALLACKKHDGSAGTKCSSDADCKNGFTCQGRTCVVKVAAEPAATPPATPAAAPQAPAVASAAPTSDRNTVPDPWTYPETGFTAIATTCPDPYVVVVTLPEKAAADYDYYYTRYMLHTYSRSFTEVPSAAGLGPRQVAFREVNRKGQRSLVAKCGDARTANKFVAAYRNAVRGSTPQPVCGADVSAWNSVKRAITFAGKDLIPPAGDSQPAVEQQCARLGVCLAILRPETPGNPGVDCLRAPTRFDRHCTRKTTCSEVLDCLGK